MGKPTLAGRSVDIVGDGGDIVVHDKDVMGAHDVEDGDDVACAGRRSGPWLQCGDRSTPLRFCCAVKLVRTEPQTGYGRDPRIDCLSA
eukprot:6459402-Amphidinium_carterae.1